MPNNKYYKTVEYKNFYEMLKGVYQRYSKKVAVKYLKKNELITITYEEMIQDISNLKNYYDLNNIKNKNIGIISENRYEYIPIYLSAVFSNVIAPLDKELPPDSLKEVLEKFDIKVLFCTSKTKEKVEASIQKLNVKLINIDEEFDKITEVEYSINNFFSDVENTDKDKFSVLAFSSGTMGEVKGVMLSQHNIVSNLEAALKNNILKDPSLLVLPMNHTYGFNPGVLNGIYNGNTLCINMDLKTFAKDLKYYNPYYIGVVPMIVEGIYNNIIREAKRQKKENLLNKMIKISNALLKVKIDIRHLLFGNLINQRLRLMVCGGATLNPFYVEKFNELGIKLLNGYGLTECSPLVSVNMGKYNVPGSVGTIIDGDDVRIAEDGEILVKGPNVMLGYYKDEKATKGAFIDGYYKTGDFGYKDKNVLYITGRKKNLIILGNGKNFSPEEIESKLLRLPYIKECIVTTQKEDKTTLIVAKIYSEELENNIDNDIKKINDSLPKYMHIDKFEIQEKEFEKTSTKKIIRSKYA